VYSTASGCANVGLNVALDAAGVAHYGGRANQDSNGNFYIMEVQNSPGLLSGLGNLLGGIPLVGSLIQGLASTLDGLLWNGIFSQPSEFTWSSGYTWSDGYTWSNGYTWSDCYTWSSGYTWSDTEAAGDVRSGTAPQE